MRFDVIVTNPPYQKDDGGFGRSAVPIYQHFIRLAKRQNPRFILMIVPSRWSSAGKGLSDFRAEMLNDRRIKYIWFNENYDEIFKGVQIDGGVSYFLWDSDYDGDCRIVTVNREMIDDSTRPLNEFEILIRTSKAVSVIKKVLQHKLPQMSTIVSPRSVFGIPTYAVPEDQGDISVLSSRGFGFYSSDKVKKNKHLIDKWKVVVATVFGEHGVCTDKFGRRRVLSKIRICGPGVVFSDAYLAVGVFDSEEESNKLAQYVSTKFFRFLLFNGSYSKQCHRRAYKFVPALDISEEWTDEKLYQKFGLTASEIDFIEKYIKEWPEDGTVTLLHQGQPS